jgi:uncharacterized protein YcaQ
MIELTQSQARKLVLNRQGLHKANAFASGQKGLLECVERLGYIQIDTISVVQMAHLHTVWNRMPDFDPSMLDAAQRKREIFEYWSHAAAYLPMKDYRFCLPYMNAISGGQKHWRTPDKRVMRAVLKRIESEGAMRAREFETETTTSKKRKSAKPSDWGGIKPEKKALEQLFIEGKLMISHRESFQKVYDLPERVLPKGLKTSCPNIAEYCTYLIDRTLGSQGIANEAEMRYLRNTPKNLKRELAKRLETMVEEGDLVEAKVRGSEAVYFACPTNIDIAKTARVAKAVHLLSPFDNLVIQRKRLSQLFDFDYRIECYVTAKKRVYGYFCLPVLYGDQFVGRLDPKADRKKKVLRIKNLAMEKDFKLSDAFLDRFGRRLKKFADFNDCDAIVVERCNDRKLKSALKTLRGGF